MVDFWMGQSKCDPAALPALEPVFRFRWNHYPDHHLDHQIGPEPNYVEKLHVLRQNARAPT